jgi:Ca2+-binding EF-hand superfamily protein
MGFVSRCFCRLYSVLLCAYPSDFRQRYGREMAQVFGDRCRSVAETQGLRGLLWFGMRSLADWLTTTVHERIASTVEIGGAANQAFDGVPRFYIVGEFGPRPGALMQGAALSLAIFAALAFVISHKDEEYRRLLIGSHHPSRSHLLPARTSAAPQDLAAEVKATPYPDEIPIHPYFRLILVLGALDADHDNIISADEIANAPAALKKLDRNRDGKLTAEECGFGTPAKLALDLVLATRTRRGFMRIHPVLAALDVDHDGEISSSEIKRAPAALKTLDKNGDGRLTIDELLPDPTASWAAQLIFAYDKNGDGVLSKDERSSERDERVRVLLDRADRNQDGVVTEEELADAIRSRRAAAGRER